jgi:hypothetical protein
MADKSRSRRVLSQLKFVDLLTSEARTIREARERAQTLARVKNIDAAGEEVEEAVRQLLRVKLPGDYHVGQGHIVDQAWTTSPQLDVIVTDRALGPVLFREEDADFYPYEAVYAIGEVRSTYRASLKPIEEFASKLDTIRTQMRRTETPPGFVRGGIDFGTLLNLPWKPLHRDVLFSFMLFVDAGDFDVNSVTALYRDSPPDRLPNLVCLLGAGSILRAFYNGETIGLDPLFQDWDDGTDWRWYFVPSGGPDNLLAGSYGLLIYSLLGHVQRSVLRAPDELAYLRAAFPFGSALVLPRLGKPVFPEGHPSPPSEASERTG